MITGSIVALVTPMAANGEIAWDSLDKLVDMHLSQGTSAVLPVGTTGESATLSHQEHCDVIARVVKRVGERLPVIAGTGSNCTAEAIELTQEAKRLGADASLLVAPYYVRPSERGIIKHYEAIAERVDIPQILYNVPARTMSDISVEAVKYLSQAENIIGIKDATGDLVRGAELLSELPVGFAVYSGDDETAIELMLKGGHGNISVTANIAPALMSQACECALEGDAKAARAIAQQLADLSKCLFIEANPIPVKWFMQQMGLIPEGIRLPLTKPDLLSQQILAECLKLHFE